MQLIELTQTSLVALPRRSREGIRPSPDEGGSGTEADELPGMAALAVRQVVIAHRPMTLAGVAVCSSPRHAEVCLTCSELADLAALPAVFPVWQFSLSDRKSVV